MAKYKAGVLFGEELEALYTDAKENNFALPAVNVIGTDSVNAVLETAAKVKSPVIIQFSNGGAQFFAGKGMPNDKLQANIIGAVSGAQHVHAVAEYYGVPVVLHTDHAAKKWLPWISGLLDHGEAFMAKNGKPLFSSHMLDLSEEPLHENIEISAEFFKRMNPLGMSIEIELGVTGGEEDGVIVGLINYPRFPKSQDLIMAHATALGNTLLTVLGQQSFSIQTPDETVWYSYRSEDITHA